MFYINGSFVKEQQATISVLDLGLIRGYGIFDYLRTYNGRPFHLLDHLERLRYSAETVGIELPHSIDEMEEIINHLLSASPQEESSIRIVVTGGESRDQLTPEGSPSCIVHRTAFKPYPRSFYLEGIKASTTTHMRNLPMSKTTQYLPAILALKKGQAQEALYLNAKNEILEATTCNFFAFKKGVLITPQSHEILLGITREVVLRLASRLFPVEYRAIHVSEVEELDEVFLTSSTREIMPLVQIDDKRIKDGKVGKNTQILMQAFTQYTRQNSWDPLQIPRYLPQKAFI
jgi:branched-chain amino acid aminotransferase